MTESKLKITEDRKRSTNSKTAIPKFKMPSSSPSMRNKCQQRTLHRHIWLLERPLGARELAMYQQEKA